MTAALRGTDSYEFPFDETARAVNQAKKIYDLYGADDSLQFWESNTSHGYQQDKRERMYGWVERHFLGRDVESSREIPFLFEPRTGLISGLPPGNKTLADIYRNWISARPRSPLCRMIPQGQYKSSKPSENAYRKYWGLPAELSDPVLHVKEVISRSDEVIQQLVIETESGIAYPLRAPTEAPSTECDRNFSRQIPGFLLAIPKCFHEDCELSCYVRGLVKSIRVVVGPTTGHA